MESSNLASYTKKSKLKLAEGGPNFASFAKSGNKIANLATLAELVRKHAFITVYLILLVVWTLISDEEFCLLSFNCTMRGQKTILMQISCLILSPVAAPAYDVHEKCTITESTSSLQRHKFRRVSKGNCLISPQVQLVEFILTGPSAHLFST